MNKFTHLHVHSEFSVLDGMSKIKDLVDKCIRYGMYSIALTDHGNMFGIKTLADVCQKKNEEIRKKIADLEKALKAADESDREGIRSQIEEARKKLFKPIFGCEAYVAKHTPTNPEGSRFKTDQKENMSGYHLVLLAKNLTGYKNLCKIISSGWTDGFYGRPRIDRELLKQYREGLIVCSACLGGELHRLIYKGDLQGARTAARWYKHIFGDDYYIELQRHETDKPGGAKDVFERQQSQNPELVKIAQELDIQLVATNDVHFVEEEHGDAHDLLICLSTNKFVEDEDRMHYTKQEWLKTPEEMAAIFPDFPEALSNTVKIADKVEFYSIEHDPIMPIFDIPIDFATEETYRAKYTNEDLLAEFEPDEASKGKIEKLGGFDKALRVKLETDYLRELTYAGAREKYGENLSPDLCERIDFELKVMKDMGFPGYFLIVQDFIQAARDMGVSVGPGRGSAAGSVVAYCLKITDIDPLKYDLLFERFLNPDRISLPDIDIDFDDEGRAKVLDWVTKKYGKERVAHIITYGTMATKSSIKDVTRVLHLPLDLSNRLTKMIPDRFMDEDKTTGKVPDMNIPNCLNYVPELRQACENEPETKKVLDYAKQLEGTLRQTGIHACGVIIGADDITKFAPVSTAEDKNTKEKMVVTQYEGSVIESVGLIKMDFLGVTTLSVIKECLRNIKKRHGIDIDIDKVPIDDPETYQLYSEGDTVAIFQFESPGMQKYLRELKPTVFEDLIAMNALYRPGPMQYIPSFIKRKHGKEPITYDFPDMEKRLKDTYGITVYQEQVMLLSRDLAGFTRGQSDELRKAMGKKLKEKMETLKVKFMAGAAKNGFEPAEKLEKIWSDWSEFAKYAFNKSHATCYSWVSYQTAWLKAHYPAEFFAANLTYNVSNITEVSFLIEDANKHDIKVLGPDINESGIYFTVNKDGNIRFGLSALKGSGYSAADAIVQEREANGNYKSIFDFIQRVNLRACNKKTLEALVYAGAFDCFDNVHRAQYLATDKQGRSFLEKLIAYGTKKQNNSSLNQTSIFDDVHGTEEDNYPDVPDCTPWKYLEQLKYEKEVAGFYVSGHPLDPYKPVLEHFANVNLEALKQPEDLARKMQGRRLRFSGIVTSVQQSMGKNNKPFWRVKLEDYTGEYEWMLFGEDGARVKNFFEPDHMLFCEAKLETNTYTNRTNLIPVQIYFLADACEKLCRETILTFNINDISYNLGSLLNELIQLAKGNVPLSFSITSEDKDISHSFYNPKHKISPEELYKQLPKLGINYKFEMK
ncbi:MAG: DNA polymerase III subunit alpha [Bacteroidales bacterium]|jgi:DNA polymerase-3 subunit alpha|nr:DNA polymerase III subunit alpha [Bacteroidales bacterium]